MAHMNVHIYDAVICCVYKFRRHMYMCHTYPSELDAAAARGIFVLVFLVADVAHMIESCRTYE